jgi:hypothetical protein
MMTVTATGAGSAQRIDFAMQGRGMDAADISKIVFMDPGQAKKVGIILDNQPRAMLINTIMAKNIPAELTFILAQPDKAPRGIKPWEGEEILSALPQLQEENEVIVDNEDPGFTMSQVAEQSPLKKLLGIKNTDGESYSQIRPVMMPEYWQPVVQSDYYGKYIKSAVYTRSGTGEKVVKWTGIIASAGYYDVYAYIPKSGNRMMMAARQMAGGPGGGGGGGGTVVIEGQGRGGDRGGETPMMKEFNFIVYHDDGKEEIDIDFETAEPGWNKLGSYYLSPDSVKVELTNKSTGRMVLGDAVKWVKRNNQ